MLEFPLSHSNTTCDEEKMRSLLLITLLGSNLNSKWDDGWLGWLVVLWDWESLTIGSELEEGSSGGTADITIWMLSHEGSWDTVW